MFSISHYLYKLTIIRILIITKKLQTVYLMTKYNKLDMNKSKSESALPTAEGLGAKPKNEFIYKNEDDMYLFQNNDLFLQLQFRSPIKQISEYLEQYEKYCFLTEISSIGIKISQQKQYYNSITTSINNQFQKYLEKTLLYVEELIMNVHFMKYERWHYFTQVIKAYKSHLLNKDIDCYNFNPRQFAPYYSKVMDYLKHLHVRTDRAENQKIKMEIVSNKKIIQKKVGEIHETMYVKNPFRAQNQRKLQVRSDQLFQSYMYKFICETLPMQSGFGLRFQQAYDCIRKFPEFMKQFSIKGQTIAIDIIKKYNQCNSQSVSTIERKFLRMATRKQIQIKDYYNQWKSGDKITPIIRNKIERVSFSNRVICRNQQTSDNYCLAVAEEPKYPYYSIQQEEQILNNRIPANNPYFDIWEHIYDRNRLRKLHLFFEQPKVQRKINVTNKLDYATKSRKRFVKEKKKSEDNTYWQFINIRNEQEEKVWQVRDPIEEHQKRAYQFSDDFFKRSKNYSHLYSSSDENNRVLAYQRKIKLYQQYLQKYEREKRAEDQILLVKFKKSIPDRSYLQFTIKFDIKDKKKQVGQDFITRYGIKIPKFLEQMTDFPKLEEFLCNFLRQKLFREVEKYKDKQSMPLMFNVKSAQQFCNWRTIKRLGELTQTLKKYYIWGSQIIMYEQETTIDKETSGKFTIYSFSETINSKTILFELKRRLNMRVTGEIVEKYKPSEVSSLEGVLSKLQLVHRLIFNQHMETPNRDFSCRKGQHLLGLVVKYLQTQSSVQ